MRGRPRKEIKFPAGEFRVKDLAAALNVSLPLIFLRMKQEEKKIRLIRQESSSGGRPVGVYQYTE